MEERLIILIDDDYNKGWATVFRLMFERIYGGLITVYALDDLTNETISAYYRNYPTALFIQDNQLGIGVYPGIHWLEVYGKTRHIIMHTSNDIGYQAGKLGAYFFMKKDSPIYPMSNEEMRNMIIDFHKHIIMHFGLVPELMWIVYNEMNYWPEENKSHT